MTTPCVLKNGKKTKYGFGLGIGEVQGHPTVRHGDGIHGFNSVLAHYPADGLTIAVLSNSEALPSGLVERKLSRALLGIEDDVADLPVPSAEIPRVTGTYHLEGTTMDLRVWGDAGLLHAQPTGQSAVRLLRQKSGEYRADLDPRLRITFADGSPCPALTLRHGGTTLRGSRKRD